ncbi:CAP domain-containing protein [Geminocystis sp. CENA526]|uniref:CAP domain-containing protein n=1 Tax=Geminocystis sp. CENA526 TaxID=1355871 RepID=UPI003D6E62F1
MKGREPTAVDQLMLELINRARENPQLEADRLLNGLLNEGVPSNNTISLDPKQPLTFNVLLNQSAYNHSQWMLDNDIFSHTGVNGTTSKERMTIAGYEFLTPWMSGENIAWKGTTNTLDFEQFSVDNYDNLFIDRNYPNRGHRVAILQDDFQEIGIASVEGVFSVNNINYNAVMTTQNFAVSNSNKEGAFLTGVVYDDTVIEDNFYTIGEGISNVTILAENIDTGTQYQTQTWATGGYSLYLPSGNYTVNFSGDFEDNLDNNITSRMISIESENVKLDWVTNDNYFYPNDNNNPITEIIDIEDLPLEENNINKPEDSLLNQAIYRFQNTDIKGTYLYAGEEEKISIQANYPNFELEGLAFYVSLIPDENLIPIYRFQNTHVNGTYLYVGEEEKISIEANYPQFELEGLAFYVYPVGSSQGDLVYRFQNNNLSGTYLFTGEEEKNSVLQNYPNFQLEGEAFQVLY